jgi:DNA-binding transcriptional ArsR family regulator
VQTDGRNLLDAYARNYVEAQYLCIQMLSEHLSECSRAFRGDLQEMLLLAIVGQSFLARMLQTGERGDPPVTPVLTGASINACSLSEITGIPRETVRRKLKNLARRGWIEKDETGAWQIAVSGGRTKVRDDLRALDEQCMKRFAALAQALLALP